MDVDLILFDWGGTLARVAGQEEALTTGAKRAADLLVGRVDDAAMADLVHRALSAEAAAAEDPEHREVDLHALLADWAAAQGKGPSRDELDAAVNLIGEAWVGSLETFPGAAGALVELKRRGCRMGLVSNCIIPHAYCLKELDRQGVGPMLDFAVTSGDVGYRKPSPHIYDRALKHAASNGRPADVSRILFVGDSPAFDVIKPAEIGMKTALVACREGIWPEADYDRARPDLRIDAVAELPALL